MARSNTISPALRASQQRNKQLLQLHLQLRRLRDQDGARAPGSQQRRMLPADQDVCARGVGDQFKTAGAGEFPGSGGTNDCSGRLWCAGKRHCPASFPPKREALRRRVNFFGVREDQSEYQSLILTCGGLGGQAGQDGVSCKAFPNNTRRARWKSSRPVCRYAF